MNLPRLAKAIIGVAIASFLIPDLFDFSYGRIVGRVIYGAALCALLCVAFLPNRNRSDKA